MSIWTSRRVVGALILGLSLAACEPGGGGFNLLGGAQDTDTSTDNPRRNVALASAEMARGSVSLQPPAGFCVDKRSLRQDFAVLARCDSLGGKGGAQDAPLGMILVSIAAATENLDLDAMNASLVGEDTTVLDERKADGLSLLHLSGATPEGTDDTHWRGLTQIGGHAMSMVAFAPPDGQIAGARGADILKALAQRTRDNSVAADVARTVSGETPQKRQGLGGLLSSLFD